MLPPQRWTLTRYLIEERRRFPHASGDLNALVLDIALACKAIARIVAFGAIGDAPDATVAADPGVDVRAAARERLDALGNEIFVRLNEWSGHLAGMTSEAMAAPRQIDAPYPRGKYLLLFDPLDGSGNIDAGVAVGSIFSVLRAPDDVVQSGRDTTQADFLQPGAAQIAAGYAIYGPSTMFVLSVGNGVAGFTLDPNLGEFVLTHPAIQVPADTHELAIDASNRRFWEPPVKRYVDECLAGKEGARCKDFDLRWIASLVAEAHRILMRGGVVLYPRGTKDPQSPGRLRLLHEANPIAFVIEQAGGRASTGRQTLLGVRPAALHQRIGFVFGSRNEVQRVERYHHEPLAGEAANPLFAERGLFRN